MATAALALGIRSIGISARTIGSGPQIVLSSAIYEDAAIGELVGVLSVLGVSGDPIFSLVDSAGGKFALTDNIITVAGALDYETATSHTITVGVTGVDPELPDTVLTIYVLDVLESGIILTGTTVSEAATVGTNVGTLSVVVSTGTPVFSLVDDAGGKFAIDGTSLEVAAALDYETATSHSITVAATGVDPPVDDKTFTITVTDVDEVPHADILSLHPLDGATDVSSLTHLIATFDETVVLGTGVITLKKTSDNSTVEAWNVATEEGNAAGEVEIVELTQLRMHPTTALDLNTGYYVVADAGVVESLAGDPSLAISTTTAWNFTTQAAAASAGWDILLATGDSNKFYGFTGFDAVLDLDDPNVRSLGFTAPNTNLEISGQDPLDYMDDGVETGKIGHDAHFMATHYKQFGHLQSPRKGMICSNSRGGSVATVAWAASSGSAGMPIAGPAGLLTLSAERLDVCLGLTGSNAVIACIDSDGVNGYAFAAPGFDYSHLLLFRWNYHRKLQWLRNALGATTPILIVLPTTGSHGGDHGAMFLRYLRAIPANYPYTAVVDPSVAPAITQADIHYAAADQRRVAKRCYDAYLTAQANVKRVVRWDPDTIITSDGHAYNSGFTITNGGFDLAGDAVGTWKTTKATGPVRSGKAYIEIEMVNTPDVAYGYIGVCNADYPVSYIQLGTNGGGSAGGGPANMGGGFYAAGGGINDVYGYTKNWTGTTPAPVAGDRYMFAVSIASGKVWVGLNGTWMNSGNPAADTGAWLHDVVDPVYIAASVHSGTANIWRLHPRMEDFVYTPPTDFEPWDQADFIPPEPTEGGPEVGDGLLLQDGTSFLQLEDDFYLVLE